MSKVFNPVARPTRSSIFWGSKGGDHGNQTKKAQRLLRIEDPHAVSKMRNSFFLGQKGFLLFRKFPTSFNKKPLNFWLVVFFWTLSKGCAKVTASDYDSWSSKTLPGVVFLGGIRNTVAPVNVKPRAHEVHFLGLSQTSLVHFLGGDELSILLPMKNWKEEKFRSVLT